MPRAVCVRKLQVIHFGAGDIAPSGVSTRVWGDALSGAGRAPLCRTRAHDEEKYLVSVTGVLRGKSLSASGDIMSCAPTMRDYFVLFG